jgi:Ca-activated chloride channel family protein
VSFGAPLWLLALLLVPAVLAAHRLQRERRRRYAVRFTAVPTLRAAAAAVPAWQRHLAPALALASLAALAIALARPHTSAAVPVQRARLMLVTDHSRSMEATDVAPTRLGAAQRAANTFLDRVPKRIPVGVVAFSTQPDAVQAPTPDHSQVRSVIDEQVADGATATGDALQATLDLLTQSHDRNVPAAIVLLSDGATTIGRDPVPVAREAGHDHIPIYTVALGTSNAILPNPDPFSPPQFVPPDPETLRRISQASGGRAFTAQNDQQLSTIYQHLGTQLGTRRRSHEVTASFAIAGLVLLLGAGVASVRGAGRLP